MDTPETDKAERMAYAGEYMVPTEFAQQLERERDEAREALDQASLYISEFTGSCPNESLDVEPHDEPCSYVCDKYANDMHLCWKKHFTNKQGAK